jgi:hypothetical protein
MFKFLSSEPLHQPLEAPTPVDETTIKCTTCYMCACRCGIRVHLREGEDGPEVRYIDGNPKHPLNQGVICAKGASGIMKQKSLRGSRNRSCVKPAANAVLLSLKRSAGSVLTTF